MKIVLCVDRDDDIGRQLKVNGPIIGAKKNLKVANDLAIIDPEDSDVNAIFGAVKIANDIGAEVVTITGDKQVGTVSDIRLSEQLDKVIKKLNPESVILVTDGAEDDEILPMIQSRIKVDAKRTIFVRQSKELEKAYFTITHFIKEISEDPNLARLVFAVPGLVLLFIAIGGALGIITQSLLAILFLIGAYLVIKGVGLEEEFFFRISEFLRSLSIDRISTLTYVLSVITMVIGLGYGFEEFSSETPHGVVETLVTILTLDSLNIVILAIVIAIVGRIMDDYKVERYLAIRNYIILLAFVLLLALMAKSAAEYWKEPNIGNFIFWIILGVLSFGLVIKITEYMFIDEIQARRNVIAAYSHKKVFTEDGKELGKVSRVLLNDSKLLGIRVGRHKVMKDDLRFSEDKDKKNERIIARI